MKTVTMPQQKSSLLLTQDENDLIFSLLGFKCQTLATTVVELYTTGGPNGHEWIYRDTGVLCLVKDSSKRSYFFRLYCPLRKTMVWEHEVYNNIQYYNLTNFLHSFEAENCIAGFNFANEEEGSKLRAILLDTVENKKQRREKRNRTQNNVGGHAAPQSNGMGYHSSPVYQQAPIRQAGRKEAKRKLTKADIGIPLDFRHVSHVGWDPNKGFDLDKADDPQLKEFFVQAGVSENHLRDRETREFIYDFIQRNGGIEAVKGEMDLDPPPVPVRVRAPPPPPQRVLGPPPPPPPPPQRLQPPRTLPPAPKLPVEESGGVAEVNCPPPPPPPPPGPPPPPMQEDPKSALLQELTGNRKQLKPLNVTALEPTEEKKPPPDSHGQLMDQIRRGIDLKPVSPVSAGPDQTVQQSGLAGALARALAERSKVIHSDSSSSSGDEDEEDEWED